MAALDCDILLIEDDIKLANLIIKYLESHGCRVTHLSKGLDVNKLSCSSQFDLIVCDVMLPDIDGFSLQGILQNKLASHVIFLTAIGDDDYHIKGLDLGAIDYIVKPIEPDVLLARIKLNLRKTQPQSVINTVTIGDLELDKKYKQVRHQGELLELTCNDFDLLWVFVQHQGELLSREFLFQVIIGREYNGLDRIIDARTMRLRKKIADFNIPGLSISTMWGKGYMFSYNAE